MVEIEGRRHDCPTPAPGSESATVPGVACPRCAEPLSVYDGGDGNVVAAAEKVVHSDEALRSAIDLLKFVEADAGLYRIKQALALETERAKAAR